MNFAKLRITVAVWLLRLKNVARNIVALAGVLVSIFGGYVLLQLWLYLPIQSGIIGNLPTVIGLTTYDGAIIMAVGLLVFWLSGRW